MAARVFLIFFYLSLTKAYLAGALEPGVAVPPDHDYQQLQRTETENGRIGRAQSLQADAYVVRRQEQSRELGNNTPLNRNISPGEVQTWLVSSQVLDADPGDVGTGLPTEDIGSDSRRSSHGELKRQTEKTVYVSINVCTQPSSSTLASAGRVPPPLTLYVSQSDGNQQPGPGSVGKQQQATVADGGYALYTLTVSSNVYVGVAADNTTTFTGHWNYEIAASIDAPYHQVETDATKPNLHFVDADNHAALLITDDLTSAASNTTVYQAWMALSPPYGMFAQDQKDNSIVGVRRSYCGLSNSAKAIANQRGTENQNVAGMTNRGLGAQPKEQFYLTALSASSTYWGFLAMQGNSTASGGGVVGGGGKVWPSINFTTKAESNCALMYNLTFCSEVAYAVPTNPLLFSPLTGLPQLSAIYDDYARNMYQNFNYSLQQIPCNASATSAYSLARNCDDCAAAYKQWLCAVTIPRCEDFTNLKPWLQTRNVGQPFANGTSIGASLGNDQALLNNVATNSSRSQVIDQQIKPGPYKEVLPCEDLCYDLVKSCPAALGFGCPLKGHGLNNSYGFRTGDGGEITCSYLGAAYYLGGAGRLASLFSINFLTAWVILVSLAFIL